MLSCFFDEKYRFYVSRKPELAKGQRIFLQDVFPMLKRLHSQTRLADISEFWEVRRSRVFTGAFRNILDHQIGVDQKSP